MSLRIMIVDDEPLARERIKCLLEQEPDVELAGECSDGLSAASALQNEDVDLVFLDIQMPEMDGFQVLEALPAGKKKPAVIVTTAYENYALRAFEVNACDYLLKPVRIERLRKALDRVRSRAVSAGAEPPAAEYRPAEHTIGDRAIPPPESLGNQELVAAPQPVGSLSSQIAAALAEADSRRTHSNRIVLKADGEIVCLKPEEIDWIESAGNYVCVHTGGLTRLMRKTLRAMEAKLSAFSFMRVHRSSLVNLLKIKALRPVMYGDYAIELRDGTKLTLSRKYRRGVLQRLKRT